MVATFATLAFRRLQQISSSVEAASVLGMFVLIWLAHVFHVLCVDEYVLPKAESTPSSPWKWKAAYKMWANPRWIGIDKPAPTVCQESSTAATKANRKSATDLARRRAFFYQRCRSLILLCSQNVLRVYLFSTPHPHFFRPLTRSDFSPSKQVYLRRLLSGTITTRETMVRSVFAVYWVWSAYIVFTAIHDLLALLFIYILNLDDPSDWPRLYGDPAESYTLRRFWGKFWHRIVYRPYTAYGALITQGVLKIPRHSPVNRVLVNFLVFFFSGIVHALVTLQLGFRCGIWQDIAWFCANFVGIMVEDGVQSAVLKAFKVRGRYQFYFRMIGYMWVFGFFFWSVPKWQYPKVYCGKG